MCSGFRVQGSGFRVQSLAFIIHHSSFIIHHSSVIIHHSSFIIHHSSFIIHHSSVIIHHSSFIIHHFNLSSQSQPAGPRPIHAFLERDVEPSPTSRDHALHPARGQSPHEFRRQVSLAHAGCFECSSPTESCENARPKHKACRSIRRTISRSHAAGRCCVPPSSGRDTGSSKILFYAATPFQNIEAGNIPGSIFVSVST